MQGSKYLSCVKDFEAHVQFDAVYLYIYMHTQICALPSNNKHLHTVPISFHNEVLICAVFAGRRGLPGGSGEPGEHPCFRGPPQPATRNPGETQRQWRVPRGGQDPGSSSSHQRPLHRQDGRHGAVK